MNITNFNLLNRLTCSIMIQRGTKKRVQHNKPLKSWTNGIPYDGFVHFPRHQDEVDPPITPTKLFMVQRIKPFKGTQHKFKDILTDIGLGEDEKMTKVVVLKNLPEVNKRLYQIKHLLKITPIKFMNGEPTAEDIKYCHLNEWGELTITKDISRVDPDKLQLTEQYFNNPKHLDADTKKKHFRLQWLNPYY